MKNNKLIRVAVYMSLILILESSVPAFGMDMITDTTDDLVITDIVETDAEDIIVSDEKNTVDVVDPIGVDDTGDDVVVESEIFTLDVNDPEGISENNIASGSYGDVTWVIRDDGTLIVEGTGEFKANSEDEAPWYEWRYAIKDAEINLAGTKDLSKLMHDLFKLNRVDLSGLDTSDTTDMHRMFMGCSTLEKLDLSGLDTSNVTDMQEMFFNCTSLKSLNLSGINTSNVTNMGNIFYNCSLLDTIDVSGFDTSKVVNMADMFCECHSLTSLDISGFDTSSVTDMQGMFSGCWNLTELDLSKFSTSKAERIYSMLDDCNSLKNVWVPVNLNLEVELPSTFLKKDKLSEEYTKLPMNVTESFEIVRSDSIVRVEGVSVNPPSMEMLVGGSLSVSAIVTPKDAFDPSCTWTSSDETVAAVDEKGTVTGIKFGSAKITATTNDGGFSAVCAVTVTKEVENEKEMENGDKIDFEVTDQTGSLKLHVEDTKALPLQVLINSDDTLRDYKEIEYYDIYLTDENDDEVTGFGKCTVYIPLQSKMIPYKNNIRVVSILDNEIDDSIESSLITRDGIKFVKFTTPHFTYFAVMCGNFIHNTLNDDDNKKDDNKKDDNGNKSIDTIGGFINTTINDTSKSTTKSSSSGSSSASSSGSSSGSSESSSSGGTVSDILKVETRSSSKTPAYSQVNTSAEAGSLSDKSDKSSDKAGSSRAKDPVPKTGDRKWYK